MKLTKAQLKEIINEVINEMSPTTWGTGATYENDENDEDVNEADYSKVSMPGQIKMKMDKFVNALNSAQLNRPRQLNVLMQTLKALGISSKDLMQYVQKVKQGMK